MSTNTEPFTRSSAQGARRAPGSLLPSLIFVLGTIVPVLVSGCECGTATLGRSCRTASDCPSPMLCVDNMCRSPASPGTDAGPPTPRADCTATPPVSFPETCNGVDDDCDGLADEGVTNVCGTCDPSCIGSRAGRGGDPFDLERDESDGVGLDDEGAIVLDSRRIETAFIWIANTGEGTVSKVDTRTRTEVARYRTGPLGGAADDPSRTSVNGLGDVYVGNRQGRSVTKISVLGADCPDTNGDGMITTSSGPTDVLPWGQDDCVLWNTSVPDGGIIRAVAAQDTFGPDGELFTAVWIGGWEGVVWKLDGETGGIVVRTASPTNNYGFALDGDGNLWISGRSARALGRIDTRRCIDTASCEVPICDATGDDCIKQAIPVPGSHNPYGITVDPMQRVWMCSHGSASVLRFDPAAAGERWTETNVGVNCHGIAADAAGWIWAAGWSDGVVRLTADDPASYLIVPGTGGFNSKGMAVDFDGYVWSINQGSSDATVIEPGPTLADADVFTGVVPHGTLRYTYSDMTGTQLRLATNPRGYWRRPFEGCTDSERAVTNWTQLHFEADLPPGTTIRFRARTAATRAGLADAMWVVVGEAPPGTSPLDAAAAFSAAGITSGRWIGVEAALEAMRTGTLEAPVSPRLFALAATRACPPILD